MTIDKLRVSLFALVVVTRASLLMGMETASEDLTACPLPHGVVILRGQWGRTPVSGRSEGSIFRLADAATTEMVEIRPDDAPEDVIGRVKAKGLGDLSWQADGVLIAYSGRIQDKGVSYLHEFTGIQMDRPTEASVRTLGDRPTLIPGGLRGPLLGHCYLVESCGGRYALVRTVAVESDRVTLQWGFQPNGTPRFTIPKGELSVRTFVGQRVLPKGSVEGRNAMPALRRDVEYFLAAQNDFISRMISTVADEGTDRSSRAAALAALGKLRASRAASVLAANIDFLYPMGEKPAMAGRPMDLPLQYPALQALVCVGLPAREPILDALTSVEERSRTARVKRRLHAEALLRILGEEGALAALRDRRSAIDGRSALGTENIDAAIRHIALIKTDQRPIRKK
ncbi:MAG: hypothetical protein ACYTKD_25570 [Planctomycetota bacterium]